LRKNKVSEGGKALSRFKRSCFLVKGKVWLDKAALAIDGGAFIRRGYVVLRQAGGCGMRPDYLRVSRLGFLSAPLYLFFITCYNKFNKLLYCAAVITTVKSTFFRYQRPSAPKPAAVLLSR
jgi:hypothetical protein